MSFNFSGPVQKASTQAALKSPRTRKRDGRRTRGVVSTCVEVFECARGDGCTQASVLALSTDSEKSDEVLLGVWS